MTTCGVRVFLNASYEDIKYECGIPRSTMTSNLRKICHPLQCRNVRHLQQRMKKREVSRSNLREVIQLSVKNNKVVIPTYLIMDEESFVVAAAEIEGAPRLPVDTTMIAAELQCVVASVNARPTHKEISLKSV